MEMKTIFNGGSDQKEETTETTRQARDSYTREANQRTYYDTGNWLDIPAHIENDYLNKNLKLGWIRIFINGDEDYKSVGKKINEGWEFVHSDELPEMTTGYGYHKESDRFQDCIVRGDVALAKIPLDIWNSKKERNLQKNRDMNDAINQRLMSMQDRRMPITNNSSSRVTVGHRPVGFDE